MLLTVYRHGWRHGCTGNWSIILDVLTFINVVNLNVDLGLNYVTVFTGYPASHPLMVQEKRDLLHHQLADAERQRINGLGSSGADSLLFVTVSAPVVRATLPSAYTEDAEAGSPNS